MTDDNLPILIDMRTRETGSGGMAMPRNILIFSDGTGQAGGLTPDQNVSNIYKLYRATRCGPDTAIDPKEQLTFYDPGLGSRPATGIFFLTRAYRWLQDWVSQATGLGITNNIMDCYAALVRMWQPGDRIFLFGFSRGAYTVRCLASVISLCGIPTTMSDGAPLFRDQASTRKIAREAVRWVYAHVGSPKDKNYVEQRKALALRFRQKYRADHSGKSNVDAFFIGVFDTVASLGSYRTGFTVVAGLLAALLAASFILWLLSLPFWPTFGALVALTLIVGALWYAAAHVQFAVGLPGYSFWQTLHFTSWKMQFYDKHLDNDVWYARHAMSIDEDRADFARVPWASAENSGPQRPDSYPDWLDQIWFAGNHSDIGGSYAENESRLSDITLDWMVHAARNLPGTDGLAGSGIKVDRDWLTLNPDPLGPQHDEREPGWLKKKLWPKGLRSVDHNAMLHASVYERFAAEAVQHFYQMQPYRPENLANHDNLEQYYQT
jgi:uncharacterized protein (DUF2235 family)